MLERMGLVISDRAPARVEFFMAAPPTLKASARHSAVALAASNRLNMSCPSTSSQFLRMSSYK